MSKWTAIAFRSPATDNTWIAYNKPETVAQATIDAYIRADKAGHIWLMHRRVGPVGMNQFELVIRDKKQATRSRVTREKQTPERARSVRASGKEMLDRLH